MIKKTESTLETGLEHRVEHTVSAEMSPPHLRGVLATWRLIGLIEDACLDASTPHLPPQQTTVGTRVEISHVGVGRLGERVEVRVTLQKITGGRLLTFAVEARGPAGVIGSGTHQRLVVEKARFEHG